MPHVLKVMPVTYEGVEYGYIRIYTFQVEDDQAFLDEFVRLVKELPKNIIDLIFHGDRKHFSEGSNSGFEGVVNNLERRYHETDSDYVREEIEQYMIEKRCEVCQGKRLRPEILSVTVAGKSINDITELSIDKVKYFFESLIAKSNHKKQESLTKVN